MADTITTTREMTINLMSADGEYNRILRILNPNTETTRAEIVTALAPALTAKASDAENAEIVPFFYDDNDPSKGLTVLGETEIIITVKTVKKIE